MILDQWFLSLENTAVATTVRESTWLFPTIETLHVLAITLTAGSIMMVDLRLLHLSARDRHVRAVADEILPWTWTAFAFAVVTGGTLFSSHALKYANNFDFRMKMALLGVAGLNMLIFHLGAFRRVALWDTGGGPPSAARWAGAISLGVWITVIGFGRWIGFTT
jgi:putative copper export protein